ncbi:hypothetical protein MASR1M60_11080 [Rhodocyclaceae bacterium]
MPSILLLLPLCWPPILTQSSVVAASCNCSSLGVGEVLGFQTELKYGIDHPTCFIDTQPLMHAILL